MRLLLVFIFGHLAIGAEACPKLSGRYTCTVKNETFELVLTQSKDPRGITTYVFNDNDGDDEERAKPPQLVADKVEHKETFDEGRGYRISTSQCQDEKLLSKFEGKERDYLYEVEIEYSGNMEAYINPEDQLVRRSYGQIIIKNKSMDFEDTEVCTPYQPPILDK